MESCGNPAKRKRWVNLEVPHQPTSRRSRHCGELVVADRSLEWCGGERVLKFGVDMVSEGGGSGVGG